MTCEDWVDIRFSVAHSPFSVFPVILELTKIVFLPQDDELSSPTSYFLWRSLIIFHHPLLPEVVTWRMEGDPYRAGALASRGMKDGRPGADEDMQSYFPIHLGRTKMNWEWKQTKWRRDSHHPSHPQRAAEGLASRTQFMILFTLRLMRYSRWNDQTWRVGDPKIWINLKLWLLFCQLL